MSRLFIVVVLQGNSPYSLYHIFLLVDNGHVTQIVEYIDDYSTIVPWV